MSSAVATTNVTRSVAVPGSRRLSRSRVLGLQVLVGVLVLGAWELAAVNEIINPILLGKPSGVITRFVEMIAGETVYSRTIYDHLWATLQVILIGYVIGSIAGILAGFALGRQERAARILEPFILALAAIPKIAIAPLFVIMLGINAESKIAIVFIEVFFMVFFNTTRGVREINEEYVSIARIMGASRFRVLRQIILPAAMPDIMVGLRMGVPYAMIGAILGEYIASNQGLGWLVLYSAASFDADGLWAALLFLVLTTWVLTRLLRIAQNRLMSWMPRHAASAEAAV